MMRRFVVVLAAAGFLGWAGGCGEGEKIKVQNTSGVQLQPLPPPKAPGAGQDSPPADKKRQPGANAQ
jgi:hypothetical protein